MRPTTRRKYHSNFERFSDFILLIKRHLCIFCSQCGSILFAQLEIWKVNSMEDTHLDVNNLLCDTNAQSSSPSIDVSDGEYIVFFFITEKYK